MKYLGTAIGCTVMLLMTLPRYGGFLLGFFLIFLFPLFLSSGIRMYRHKSERKVRGKKLAVWMSAILVTLAVNYYRHSYTRDAANDVVAKIASYYETNSFYPRNLQVLGYDSKSLKSSLGMYVYHNKDGQPSFIYWVPHTIFDTYHYNFDSGKWIYSTY